MKIVIDQSGYALLNLGDLAMLQAAVARLKSFWEDADIYVFTTSPERLSKNIPEAKALSPEGRQLWFSPMLDYAAKISNKNIANACLQLDQRLRNHTPLLFKLLFAQKLKRYSSSYVRSFELFRKTMDDADLVIATGGGYINDLFKEHAISVLNTVSFGSQLKKPTALLGQGFGPLQDFQLIEKQKQVLPQISLIGVREKKYSVPLLRNLGVNQDQIHITGDDAIELAYHARPKRLGNSIGVNLRLASYSSVDGSAIQSLQNALYHAADVLKANLVPTPISLYSHSGEVPDSEAINDLLKQYSVASEPGEAIDTPLKAIQQVGRCRLVITGSYHAGVFALSQGIPVIGLVMSEYYREKFSGLADQFSIGCEVICLDDNQFEDKLLDSIQTLWAEAESLRPQLLKSAELQIQSGWNAYRKLYELVSSHRN